MRPLTALVALLLSRPCLTQTPNPGERPVARFEVKGSSRLAALAYLGAMTNTTLLVQVEKLSYAQVPITVSMHHTTLNGIAAKILSGESPFELRTVGSLLIISIGSSPGNGLLQLPLGAFDYTEKNISTLHPLIGYFLRRATGCHPTGYMWAGPSMDLAMPPIHLTDATAEQIIARVAEGPGASMWIVPAGPIPAGCNNDPLGNWQVGLYVLPNDGGDCQHPFRASVGPNILGIDPQKVTFPEGCSSFPTMRDLKSSPPVP